VRSTGAGRFGAVRAFNGFAAKECHLREGTSSPQRHVIPAKAVIQL
jgi:hypothetical protein